VLSESCKQDPDRLSHLQTSAPAAMSVERIAGRVCRLENGGRVVAVVGGREIVVEGIEVREAVSAVA
jgi:hypothetical protein